MMFLMTFVPVLVLSAVLMGLMIALSRERPIRGSCGGIAGECKICNGDSENCEEKSEKG